MTKKNAIEYWVASSKENYDTAVILLDNRKYSHCLFFCHLSLEKLLKAKIIETQSTAPPPIHDLVRLAKKAKITLTDEKRDLLSEITTFNLEARYDDYRMQFYKKATLSFTKKYLEETKKLIKWLK